MTQAVGHLTLKEHEAAQMRRVSFRDCEYVLAPIGPQDPGGLLAQEGEPALAQDFDPERWVLGLSVARAEHPGDPLGFYAVAWTDAPDRFDHTLAFVAPRARGLHLSHLLVYGVYLELLELDRPFVLCELIDHPRLKFHARCGFAPPVRPLRSGKVEIGRFDLHTVLSRLESEDDIREVPAPS